MGCCETELRRGTDLRSMLKNVLSLELSSALSETYAVGIEDVGALGFSAEEREDGAGDAVSLSAAILLGVEVITGSL